MMPYIILSIFENLNMVSKSSAPFNLILQLNTIILVLSTLVHAFLIDVPANSVYVSTQCTVNSYRAIAFVEPVILHRFLPSISSYRKTLSYLLKRNVCPLPLFAHKYHRLGLRPPSEFRHTVASMSSTVDGMEGANGSERSGSGLGILALAAFHVKNDAVLASGGHDGLVRLWRIQASPEVLHVATIILRLFR